MRRGLGRDREGDGWFLRLRERIEYLQKDYCGARSCLSCADRFGGLVEITAGGGVNYDEEELKRNGIFGKDVKEILKNYCKALDEKFLLIR